MVIKITKLKEDKPKRLGISFFNIPSLLAINLPVRRDGDRVTQDWFNDIRDALLGGVVSPSLTGVVVGDAQDVADGNAVYSSIQAAHDAATTTDLVNLLARTWVENLHLTKPLQWSGKGFKSVINGNVFFETGSSGSGMFNLYFAEGITIETGVIGIYIDFCWGAEPKADLIDNSGITEANFWAIQR